MALLDLPRTGAFHEVAGRVWVARHTWFDVNVCAVAGQRGVVLVDTLASEPAARAMLDRLSHDVRREVVAVVNTHEHFDHTFGNGAAREAWPGVPLIAHETAAERTRPAGERIQAECGTGPGDPEAEIAATRIEPATTTFSSVHVVDLGDRALELVHPGRGHTGGDLVVRVLDADADVLLAGDLVEESAERSGVPGLGPDCHPMEYPLTLDVVLELVQADTVVVPGHGNPVGRDFVREQRADLGVVAETIRDLAGRGVPLDEALDAAEWPWPKEHLRDAVRRGYEHLPRAARRLPLV